VSAADNAEALFDAPPPAEQERMVEAILFASAEPLSLAQIGERLPHGSDAGVALELLRERYQGRGVAVTRIGPGWALRTAPDLGFLMRREARETRRLSRAAIETLAIVAYHQPVTRGEIEEIRGVALSKGTLDTLLEAGWAGPKGRRRTPGRPVTWGTTDAFLDHFGLERLDTLPGLAELKAAGLLDTRPAIAALNASGRLAELAAEGEGGSGGEPSDEAEGDIDEDAGDEIGDGAAAALAADFGEELVPEDEAQNTATEDAARGA